MSYLPDFSAGGRLGAALIGEAEAINVAAVLRSRALFRHTADPKNSWAVRFEAAVCDELGVPRALGVSSGTAAIRAALAGLDVGEGDEVIVPSLSFIASVSPVVRAGAVPVFVDVDARLTMDPDAIGERITERTRGIVVAHLQGVAARIDAIVEVAADAGLWVLEDCAQAYGVSVGDRPCGTIGDFGSFSLQEAKTITAGEGGFLTGADPAAYARAVSFHDQGGVRPPGGYPSWDGCKAGFGENAKISEVTAAIALAQLGRLDHIREQVVDLHTQLLDAINLGGRAVRQGASDPGALPYSFAFYAYDAEDRARILTHLEHAGVPADGLYGEPLYRLSPFIRWAQGEPVHGVPRGERRPTLTPCPTSEELGSRLVRIPLGATYGPYEIEAIVRALEECLP